MAHTPRDLWKKVRDLDAAERSRPRTIVEMVVDQAARYPHHPIYTFLADGEVEAKRLTFAELDRVARGIGAALEDMGAAGERALLLYPQGLEFIEAFLGCLYGGAVAVPAYPPRSARSQPRLRAIIRNARPRVVLTSSALLDRTRSQLEEIPELANALWLATDNLETRAAAWREPSIDGDTIAFLQYTSGSTSAPKGVIISHANLLHNEEMIRRAFAQSEDSVILGWLPLYHDMGLIGNVLQPLYIGASCILMSPVAFLQKPLRWLAAISRYRATTSGGPNFAYELCVRKITDEQKARLDLSSWRVAFNGAEPVRPETLDRFTAAFASCGFRRKSFYPCYGLAEATLLVTVGSSKTSPVVSHFEAAALERAEVVETVEDARTRALVGCGRVWTEQYLAIVDPATSQHAGPHRVGEVWVAGPSVALGYWQKPEQTERDFHAFLSDGSGPFLRTGDLGFIVNGELYITGRIKDLIIIRGRNYYPQDLEQTAERAHPLLRSGCSAAFAVEEEREERLVLVLEIERRAEKYDPHEVAEVVRAAVAAEHEVQVSGVVLIRAGTLPMTSSGKVQRYACRAAWENGELAIIASWHFDTAATMIDEGAKLSRAALLTLDASERQPLLEVWLRELVAHLLHVAPDRVAMDSSLASLGLDTLMAVELQWQVERNLGVSMRQLSLLGETSLAELAAAVLAEYLALAPEQDSIVATKDIRETAQDLPLSYGQRGLWFLQQIAPVSAAWNITAALDVRGDLEVDALRRALQALSDRHPTLRTTYAAVPGGAVQRIYPAGQGIDFHFEEALGAAGETLAARLREKLYRPFDLAVGPLLRAVIFRCAPGVYALGLAVHHIAADYWSLAVMFDELGQLYAAETGGEEAALSPLTVTYADWVRWQNEWLAGKEGERLWEWWREALREPFPDLDLPTDRLRPAVQTDRGATLSRVMAPQVSAALLTLARSSGATLFVTLLAGFQALLYRMSGQLRIAVGCPVAGRSAPELAPVVGYFVNPVVIRVDLSGAPTGTDLLARTRRVALDALEHSEYPFALLTERLQPERDLSRSPLFQAMFVLLKSHRPEQRSLAGLALADPETNVRLGPLDLRSIPLGEKPAQFDLVLSVADQDNRLAMAVHVNTDLFDLASAERMLGHFSILLEALVAEPSQPIADLPLLTPEEREQMLVVWNDTLADSPRMMIHELFAEQAERTPDRIALFQDELQGGVSLTYRQLSQQSAALAAYLRHLGVGPEVPVGICLDRTPDVVVGVLGVLAAGGFYVPLDPSYPQKRIAYILADSSAPVVLTEERLRPRLGNWMGRLVCLDTDAAEIRQAGELRLRDSGGDPNQLAYLIYTSGSTGRPKGVQVLHRGVVNLLASMRREPGLRLDDVLVSTTTISFDIAALELYLPLSVGACLVLASRETARDAAALLRLLRTVGATVMQTTPAAWQMLLAAGWDGSPRLRVLCGGEALSRDLADAIARRSAELWNLYGPTETTIWSALHRVDEGRPGLVVPIGRPIANTTIFVVSPDFQPVPVGVPGELLIGGDGVARGYFRQPALTAERFVPDPFGPPGSRLYCTGDLARFRAGGEIEFLGRLDHQVKVRGFRIELGEIEAALAVHPAVREVVVLAREDAPGDRRLVAYVVLAEGKSLSLPVLRSWLSDRLPEYMVPALFMELPALPLTPNGKVDRKALPAPEQRHAEVMVAPQTPVEEVLAALWAQVLGSNRVGVTDSFFDLGGHSLLATQVVSQVRSVFGVDLPVRTLFEAPTVAAFARRIGESRQSAGTWKVPEIVRQDRRGRLPLSFAQQRLWFLDRLEPGGWTYNIPLALRLEGGLDPAALHAALRELMRRHESLRTIYPEFEGEPVQAIQPAGETPLSQVDLADLALEARQRELRLVSRLQVRRPFDLGRDPMLRAILVRLGDEEHVLLLTVHHIASDGWSMGILWRELGALYEAARSARPSPLPELLIQYADFACWQRSWLSGEVLEADIAHWRRRLAGASHILELPTDRPRPPIQNSAGSVERLHLSEDLAEALRSWARQQRVTLFMVLLSGWQALVSRITGQEDFNIGTPISGRSRLELEGLIGFFVNTLVLRCDMSGDPDVSELLSRVRETALNAYAHQDLPFDKLVEELAPERSLAHSPLFQVMLVLQNARQAGNATLSGLRTSWLETDELEAAKFDLTLYIEERPNAGLDLALSYRTELFDAPSVQRMLLRFEALLGTLASDPWRRLSELSVLTQSEQVQLLFEWNDTGRPRREFCCLHELFAAQAGRSPEAVAVFDGERELSYAELDQWSNRLANHLRQLGVGPEVPVALCLERSARMVIAILGVLKAAGAYVPLDPAYPPERLHLMVADSAARVIVTESALAEIVPRTAAFRVLMDDELLERQSATAPAPDNRAYPDNLAYVIYTSGSTGGPKGVAIAHRSASVLLEWAQQVYAPEQIAGVLASTSICFDLSIFELFVPLTRGGMVILSSNVLALPRLPGAHRVTLVNTVPSAIAELIRSGGLPSSVATVNLAGESLSPSLVEQIYGVRTVREVYNLYGPSEDTTYSTWAKMDPEPGFLCPIGRPISGTGSYVLDPRGSLVPIGSPGELFLGGEGLARGYLGRPDLTAERFVPDPFGPPGSRLYHTGDLVRWRQDGNLEYLGRLDHQVKVRGFRIELGEIEATLRSHPAVRDAVVALRLSPGGDPRLVAFTVCEKTEGTTRTRTTERTELRAYLKDRLPEYMVPALFMELPALPLTPNGKVDRRALAALDPESFVAPTTHVEELLAAVWGQVLGLERVGATDDFFELGGHSLLVTQVISRVRSLFGVELPLRTLFEASILAELARRIEESRQSDTWKAPEIVPHDRREKLPLSFAQQRLWFLDRLEPGGWTYNIPLALRIEGDLDPAALQAALRELVRRHESLRTIFLVTEGEPFQVIQPAGITPLPLIDLADLAPKARQRELRLVSRLQAQRPFNLGRDLMLRALLVRLGDEEHVLLLTVHHIASDGWSMEILGRELGALYETPRFARPSPLPELPIQYSDFACWQRSWLSGEGLADEIAYWSRRLTGASQILELPTDHPRPAIQGSAGSVERLHLSEDLTKALRSLARRQTVTLFMVLLSGWQALLSRLTGQEDFNIGTPISGRNRLELEDLIGFFVNTLVLRCDMSGDPDVSELLSRAREMALDAYAHQALPFERLVEELQPARSLAHSPLFQVMLVFQNARQDGSAGLSGLRTTRLQTDELEAAKFDLTLYIEERPSAGLELALSYRTELFDAPSVHRMLLHLETLLGALASDPSWRQLSKLSLLTQPERVQLLFEWNDTGWPRREICCLHELFTAQAGHSPEAVAVVDSERELSYTELDQWSNRLANHLRQLGVGPEVPVALCLERSARMVVAILGVLKAAGAYVPLDPAYPRERLRWMLEDSAAPVIVTESALAEIVPETAAFRVLMDDERLERQSATAPEERAYPDNLAYVIYTSGSTGRPKGVAIAHRSASVLLEWAQEVYAPEQIEGVLAATSICFDLSIFELFVPLTRGGTVILAPNVLALPELPGAHRVTLVNTIPPAIAELIRSGGLPSSVTTVNLAGELLPPSLVEQIYGIGTVREVYNLYGPSEDTTYSTWAKMEPEPGFLCPIGRPISGTRSYVLDPRGSLVPIGSPGELFLGGEGLARGYLGRPDLTAERFLPDPFGPPGSRLYRTGDLVRWRQDGNLEYLGRLDHQVKVRGFRIELGEIEATLASHPAVQQAVVAVREDGRGNRRLVAYVVFAGQARDRGELRRYLAGRLPDPLVPSFYVFLDQLPMSPNGKVDRRALPAPEERDEGFVVPTTPVEKVLAGIWAEVLGIDRVGVTDDFFTLGGHSLSAVRVLRRLELETGIRLNLTDFFQHPTVSALAASLKHSDEVSQRVLPLRRASTALDARSRSEPARRDSEVAIIGMAGRFPGANCVDELWLRLRSGHELITHFSEDELRSEGIDAALLADPRYVRAAGVLEKAEWFDAAFFGFTPREAELMDPQHRVFLECAWEALEDAGYDSEHIEARIGVYAGVGINTYLYHAGVERVQELARQELAGRYQMVIANDKDFLPTRVSYKLNLRGPSVNVQTACSTSLVALHLACQALATGDCDMALVGGVSIRCPQKQGYLWEAGGVLSPDGRCRAFDSRSQGTVLSNGVGLVVLKRLNQALADGDRIRAIVKGSAINNDGSWKVGYSAPSVDGQARVMIQALNAAEVQPETITFIEAHGTGTPIGDAIEIAALSQAFAGFTDRRGFCAIGSIKTNLGHMDTAAGMASLIKTVLALEHGEIPPSLHFQEASPNIDFAASPFHVNSALKPWTTSGVPRRAGVNSFGIGGTNAHVVLEEAPPVEPSDASRAWQLLMLSARTAPALDAATSRLAAHLRDNPALPLADVAHTLRVGRRHFACRRVLVCRDASEAAEAMASVDPEQAPTSTVKERERPVAFLFPGLGAQHAGMARGLYASEPVFRRTVDQCTEILHPHLGLDLRELLFPRQGREAEADQALTCTDLAQPALFVIEYALACLWMKWGVRPDAMLGHSLGEYVAACLAGVFSLENALVLIAARGRLMGGLPSGSMLTINLPEAEVLPLLGRDLSLAAVNAPASCVISGPSDAVEVLERDLERSNLVSRRIYTSHAFHSAMMEPILVNFAAEVARADLQPPQASWISNMTGTWITPEQAVDPQYWSRHLCEPVRFAAGVEVLLREPARILLEVGPGHTLATLVRQHPARTGQQVLTSLPSQKETADDLEFALSALGRLWLTGLNVDWGSFNNDERRRRVPLPTYPFERKRYWLQPLEPGRTVAAEMATIVRRNDPADWFYIPIWKLAPISPGAVGQIPHRWMVLAAREESFGTRLASRLERQGHQVTAVFPGDDLAARLDAMESSGGLPEAVVHAWSFEADTSELPDADLYGLLPLARELGRRSAPIDLLVLGNGLVAVTDDESLRPALAALLGFCRVLPQECAQIFCRVIDVSLPAPGSPREADLIGRLVNEIVLRTADEQVALRGTQRWVPDWVPLHLPGGGPPLREGGVWLVTGGLQGHGYALAHSLAQSIHARLALVEPVLPLGAEERLATLKALGSEVLILETDMADETAANRAVAQVEERLGPIYGIVHAASAETGALRLIQEIRNADCAMVFRERIGTLLGLERALSGRKLKYAVLLSSLGTILGGVAYSPAVAAAAVLDAIVHDRRRRGGLPWKSLSWDAWRFADDGGPPLREDMAELALSLREGEDAFLRSLATSGMDQLMISTSDLAARAAQRSRRIEELRSRGEPTVIPELHSRPPLITPYEAPKGELEKCIATVWARVLGLDQVGVNDNFFQLGGDSILAIQVVSRLGDLKIKLAVASLFKGQTIRSLAALLDHGNELMTRRTAQLEERRAAVERHKQQYRRARKA